MGSPSDSGLPDDTAALVGASSRGDGRAVAALLERFLPALVGYVRQHAGAGVVAHESATDIAHSACREVLTRLAEARYAYTDEEHFRAWLCQTAMRKIQDRARYWQRERRDPERVQSLGEAESRLLVGLASALSPSEQVLDRERCERLAAALQQLDPRQREVVRLSYEEQLTHREIAARLDIEESHSRTLLARALARLARLLSD